MKRYPQLTREAWIILRMMRVAARGPNGRFMPRNREYLRACNYMMGRYGKEAVIAACEELAKESLQ
jgi:hypothetical protein